jgi:hypothetical protein
LCPRYFLVSFSYTMTPAPTARGSSIGQHII